MSPLSARLGIEQLLGLRAAGGRHLRLRGAEGCLESLVIARLAQALPVKERPLVVIARDEAQAQELARDLQFFLGTGAGQSDDPATSAPVLHLPNIEVSPYTDATPDRRAILQRLAALFRLSQGFTGLVLVASSLAAARRVIPRESFTALCDILQAEQDVDRDRTVRLLVEGGYTRMPVCEDPGTFAVRGGVLDLFVPLYRYPVRIEYYGDMVESLRFYDPQSQRTLRTTREIFLHPVRETILTRGHRARERVLEAGDQANHPSARTRQFLEQVEGGEDFFGIESMAPAFHSHMASLAEYLPRRPTFFLCEPHRAEDAVLEELMQADRAYEKRLSERRLCFPPSDFYLSLEEYVDFTTGSYRVESQSLVVQQAPADLVVDGEAAPAPEAEAAADVPAEDPVDDGVPTVHILAEGHGALKHTLQRARVERQEHPLKPLADRLIEHREQGMRTVLMCPNLQHAERLEGLLKVYGLAPQIHRHGVAALAAEQQEEGELHGFDLLAPARLGGRLELRLGPLGRGFDLPLDNVALYCEAEIFGDKATRRASRAGKKQQKSDFKDLEVGAHVVHVLHGVGVYLGLKKLPVPYRGRQVEVDAVHLQYEGGTLYLPVYRLNELQRYAGAEGVKPKLDRLGGETWQKTKAKVSKEVRQMAEELLQLYAQRQALPGHGFRLDATGEELYNEFEATFPFEETPDQQKAIEDVLTDMEQERAMDRLVCGDVGYGKTEVAMRAAAKAALAGKQVAVLAPTTVLVEQHAVTFTERFKAMPIRVASLSRFRTKAEQTQAVKQLAAGTLDVVIGTHRLLSSDVRFRDLGLIIVDEEQRFGVVHKERLRKLRTEVDTLTLTATPIPRTLHMAMSGLRDLSIITTAPADRLAIRTIVARESDDLIREGIKKELARGGQVFFVHNRVETIGKWARRLHDLMPELKVLVGHGQMPPEELEQVMLDFVDGKAEVLLCTTIIESGLDIPRANTMFVDRADTFGLSQLYQLRGRIGRGRERAFCYLLVPPQESMTGEAKQRLVVLQRFSELGAGYNIATHDLEIRGAGDLLGSKQSGTIAQVGFELYTQMLAEAVAELQGQPLKPPRDPELSCDMPGFIPDDYLPDTGQRLDFYKRLSAAQNEDEVAQVLQELRDRYGTPPEEVEILADISVVKALGRRLRALTLELSETRLAMALADDTVLVPDQVLKLVQAKKTPWRFTQDGRLQRLWQGDQEKQQRLPLAKAILAELLKDVG